MNDPPLRLLGIAGSLRKASMSRKLLANLGELLPDGARLDTFPLDDVPLYNGDLEGERRPAAVNALRGAIEGADGLVLITPEYNHSIPGVLKNALDWASRPAYASPLLHKPTLAIGLSGGLIGGARGVQHLKVILLGTGSEVYPGREILVGKVGEKLDADGVLVDEGTRTFLSTELAGFASWTRRRGRWSASS